MAKKFNGDYAVGEASASMSLNATISEFVSSFAPDILESLPCMKGEPAVEYYGRLFERERQSESKRPGKNNSVEWPYAVRIIYLARKFRSLNESERQLVIDARRVKIYWRGDDHDMFQTVATETLGYRDLEPFEKANYKKRLMVMAKSLLQRHEMY